MRSARPANGLGRSTGASSSAVSSFSRSGSQSSCAGKRSSDRMSSSSTQCAVSNLLEPTTTSSSPSSSMGMRSASSSVLAKRNGTLREISITSSLPQRAHSVVRLASISSRALAMRRRVPVPTALKCTSALGFSAARISRRFGRSSIVRNPSWTALARESSKMSMYFMGRFKKISEKACGFAR